MQWTTTGPGYFDNENSLSSLYYPSEDDITAGNVTIELTIFDENDVSFTDDLLLTIIPEGAGINNLLNNIDFSVYPQPNNGNFQIIYNSKINKTLSVKITDSLGKNIYSENLSANKGENIFKINIENSKSGIYYIRILDDKYSQTKKFIINK